MIKVKCYGGPAHGRTMNLTDDAPPRFEVITKPRVDRRQIFSCCPDITKMPIGPRINTNTYYLQRYEQQGMTEERSTVYRHLRVALLDGADLLPRETHELEDAMENLPWIWSLAPSILHQFEAWWEKALHDQGWEKARVYY